MEILPSFPWDEHIMNVSILLPTLGGGGAERLHIELAREFQRHGHKVEFLLLAARGILLDEAKKDFQIVDLEVPRIRHLFVQLLKRLQQDPPDALLVAMWPLTAIAVAAIRATRARTRLIVSEHVDFRMTPSFGKLERAILHHLGSMFYRRAHGIVAVSEGVAESIAETTGIDRTSVSVIHNPVRQFAATALEPEEREKIKGWLGARHRLIAIGSLKQQKGFSTLIEAAHKLRTRVENVSLIILGDGELRPQLEEQIRHLQLTDIVHMPGFRVNPAPYLEQADLFVLSSDWEGFGNVIIESLSMGVPVVSTDCPSGPAEILGQGLYGRLVPPRDPAAMAEAIELALSETADRAALVARAKDFTLEKTAKLYLELLIGERK